MRPTLQRMPSWLMISPWLVVGCAVLLSALVMIRDLRDSNRATEFATQIMLEKGTSLINALEGVVRTAVGFHWTNAELQALVERIAAQQDIRYLVITDAEGTILWASPADLAGTILYEGNSLKALDPSSEVRWNRQPTKDGEVFQVYKQFMAEQRQRGGHMRHGGRGMRVCAPNSELLGPWNIFVGYDPAPLGAAEAADSEHTIMVSLILLFLACVGALTLLLVHSYSRSRRMVQETTAFSSEVISTLPVGIIATDAQHRISSANPAALALAGLRKEDALGKHIGTVLPSVWSVLAKPLEQDRPVLELEARCGMAQGRHIPLALSASRIVTEEGRHTGEALILRDLGELRHLQAELRRKDRLVALGTLAAGIAHEIRNPLSAIKGLARYFQESNPEGSEDVRIAATLSDEVLRLDKVVGDLLDFARHDTLRLAPIALDALLLCARRMVDERMREHLVTFRADLPSPVPVLLLDADRMTQALINLFINAVQAMQNVGGERELSVTASLVAAPCGGTETLLLQVRDTGTGIGEDKLQDIFSPYFTTKARGTGLGLSIVHKIIEAHDGSIDAKSVSGQGTVFSVRIPVR